VERPINRPLLTKTLWKSALLYGFFLIPTGLLLLYSGGNDTAISQQISGTWQAGFWQFPGATSLFSRVLLDILQALAITGLAWLFYQGFKALSALPPQDPQNGHRIFQAVLVFSLICGGLLLAVVTFHSSDLYGYLNRGFQQSIYHTNPYLTPVAEISGWKQNPLLHPHWVYNPCPYGFFFAHLANWLTHLAGPRFFTAFLLFKTLNLLLLAGTTWLIYIISRQLGLRRPGLSAYLFGANPLVLLHTMGNGHNDILLVFLLLASVAALFSSRWRWACLPLLTLSILTKYASLLALPFFMIYLLKNREYKALLIGTVLSVALGASLAAPYIDPNRAWPLSAMLDNAGKPQHSIIDLIAQSVYYPTKWIRGHADAWTEVTLSIIKPLFWAGFVTFYGWQCLQSLRQSLTPEVLIYRTGLVLTVMVAFISAKFHPWYPVMFLPLLLLLPEASRLRQFGLTFSLFQLAGFTVFQNLPVISPLALTVLPIWLTLRNKFPFRTTESR
jgi:hypothetical protein